MKDKLIIEKSPPTETISLRLRKRLWELVKEYSFQHRKFDGYYKDKNKIVYSKYIESLIVKDLREKRIKGELKGVDEKLLDVLDEIKLEGDQKY